MGQLHPLGPRFRAAGVDDLRHVEALRSFARRLPARFHEGVNIRHALDRRALLFRRQPQELAHLLRKRGGLARDLRHAAVRGEHARARMVEDEGDVVGLQHEIDWDHDRAEPHQRVSQCHEAMRIAGENGDLVAAPDPARGEARGEPLGDAVKLGVGPARRPAGEAEPAGNAPRAAPKRIAQRLPPQIGVHRSSLKLARRFPLSARALRIRNRRATDRRCKSGAQAAASARRNPSGSALMARKSVRAGPLGRFAPRSHSCTVRTLNR